MHPPEIQTLLDREAIRDALLRYARGIDRHDLELMAEAYHKGARDDHGDFIGPAEDFPAYANAVHAKNWTIHQHYITNHTIEIDGDTAHCETYWLVALRRPDGIVDLGGGRYVDRVERQNGKWAIADRVCIFDWAGETANTPREGPAPDLFIGGTWDTSDISYQRPLRLSRPDRKPTV